MEAKGHAVIVVGALVLLCDLLCNSMILCGSPFLGPIQILSDFLMTIQGRGII